jgi:DNA polymerase
MMTLAEHYKVMTAWDGCLLSKESNFVPGHGNPKADIVFIGEAPGKKEDEQGVPFVGAAGKMLDKLLDSINLKREDVFITNTVKYRPPENRDPTKAEKAECLPWLLKELEIIKPKVICPLGRHATNTFLPDAIIGEVHGTVQQSDDWPYTIIPLYHPAAALYNGGLRDVLFEDILILREFL